MCYFLMDDMAYYEDVLDDNGKLICALCSIILPDDSVVIEAHNNEEYHKKLYFNRLLIRNSMELSGNLVKCSICNSNEIAVFSSIIKHIEEQHHNELMDKIKQIVNKDGGFIELPDSEIEKKLNCLICNHEIAFKLEEIERHVSSLTHRRARAIAIQPFNGIISVEETDEDLWCKICKIYIPNFVESIFEHVDNDDWHVTSLTKLLRLKDGQNISIERYLVNGKEDKASCNKCDKEVACNILNLNDHISGSLHQNKA